MQDNNRDVRIDLKLTITSFEIKNVAIRISHYFGWQAELQEGVYFRLVSTYPSRVYF